MNNFEKAQMLIEELKIENEQLKQKIAQLSEKLVAKRVKNNF